VLRSLLTLAHPILTSQNSATAATVTEIVALSSDMGDDLYTMHSPWTVTLIATLSNDNSVSLLGCQKTAPLLKLLQWLQRNVLSTTLLTAAVNSEPIKTYRLREDFLTTQTTTTMTTTTITRTKITTPTEIPMIRPIFVSTDSTTRSTAKTPYSAM